MVSTVASRISSLLIVYLPEPLAISGYGMVPGRCNCPPSAGPVYSTALITRSCSTPPAMRNEHVDRWGPNAIPSDYDADAGGVRRACGDARAPVGGGVGGL